MAESVKKNLLPVLATACGSLLVWLIMLSFHAGAIENRVTNVERQQAANSEKIDKLLAGMNEIRVGQARIEAKLEDRPR